MIEQYELKYQKLNKELSETQKLLHAETESKKQFESDLKRVFLKNLTHMNMEAYALFNGGCADPTGASVGIAQAGTGAVGMGLGNSFPMMGSTRNDYDPESVVYQQTAIKGLAPSNPTPPLSSSATAAGAVNAGGIASVLHSSNHSHSHINSHVSFAPNTSNSTSNSTHAIVTHDPILHTNKSKPSSTTHVSGVSAVTVAVAGTAAGTNVIAHKANNTIVNKVLKKSTIMTIHKPNTATTNITSGTSNNNVTGNPYTKSLVSTEVDVRGSMENQIPRPYIVPTPVHYSSTTSSIYK